MKRSVRRLVRLIVCAAPTLVLCCAGCGGGNYGADLSARPRQTPVRLAADGAVRLPQDHKFSIFLTESSKKPGLGATADADAHASPDGSADATAKVSEGGEALALFQLGHAFTNPTERQVDLDVTVRFDFKYAADSSPAGSPVDATVGLKLYARDDRNRLDRSDEMLAHAVEKGPARSSGSKEFSFTLTLGPGRSVSVFLAGQCAVKAEFGRSGDTSLSISNVRMEAAARPARVEDGG